MDEKANKLQKLKNICDKYSINSVLPQIKVCNKMLSEETIRIAILGKFKAGKTSILNTIIGKDLLPVGVIPVTGIITELFYSEKEKAIVNFLNGDKKEIDVNSAKDYISEEFNPSNYRKVETVEIGLPSLYLYKNLRFVDTPGLESALSHNTETSLKWIPNTGIAIIAISIDSPLSDRDIALIEEIQGHTPSIFILLTKIDRLTNREVEQVVNYIKNKIEDKFKPIPVFTFSIKEDYKKLREDFFNSVFLQFTKNLISHKENILKYKIQSIENQILEYLLSAGAAASKSEKERGKLRELARSQKMRFETLKKDFKAIFERTLNSARAEIENIILLHQKIMEQELKELLFKKLSVPMNLKEMSETYRKEVKNFFNTKTLIIFDNEKHHLERINKEAAENFILMANDFTARLSIEAEKALGIKLTPNKFEMEFEKSLLPDVRVSQSFDSHLDLIWFLIPTSIFRKLFIKHFIKKASFETEKNLTRIAMKLTEIFQNRTEKIMNEAIEYAKNIQNTIENALLSSPEKINEIQKDIEDLKSTIN